MLPGFKLDAITQGRDLGIIIENPLEMSVQCAVAAKKANLVLGITRKGTENKMESIIMPSYKSILHLHLKNSVRNLMVRSLKGYCRARDIKRATKMIQGLEHLRKKGLRS